MPVFMGFGFFVGEVRNGDRRSGPQGSHIEESDALRAKGHAFFKKVSPAAPFGVKSSSPGTSTRPMSADHTHDVTRLLHAWGQGDPDAAARLLPLIYDPLRHIAREYMQRERRDHTLEPTALVHEAYLRLTGGAPIDWQGRAHFYSLAARAMRRILVDHARTRQRERRGGAQQRVPLEEAEPLVRTDDGEVPLVALDDALKRFAEAHPRPSQVVELRFFGGMDGQAIAEVLQVSERTVKREWQFAKLWLHRELGHGSEGDGR